MTVWTFHNVEGFSVSDKWANEPDDAERIARWLAEEPTWSAGGAS